jgi:2-dehydropantoate 2-reductase
VTTQPIFCAQNGVTNERLALRRFPNVHGVTVMMPAGFADAGEVNAFGAPRHGIFDIGRFPAGEDAADAALAALLEQANIAAFVMADVMASKHGKLLLNLGNIVEAALGVDADTRPLRARLRAEAETAYRAAGIPWRDVGAKDPRRDALLRTDPIEGITALGSSSTQSLVRGAGSIETDYLNGEIVRIGRENGVPVPLNAWFTDLAARLAREQRPPGTLTAADLEDALAALA